MGGRLNIDPPKSLNAFLRQVEQFTVYAANSTLGATGLADLLIVVSRYVDDILTTGYDHHVKIGKAPRVWTYVKESLTSLIYTLNWEFRGNQSPFTNVSVYDRLFLEQLVPAYLIGGTAPDIETVEKVQDLFLDAYNETLARTPITFPVVTACFSAGQGSDDARTIQDEAFLKKIARHNLKYGFINIYCGESSTLSSCCRLRSSISDLGYSNTFGAGSTKIGSLGVVTLNLPRLAGHRRAASPPSSACCASPRGRPRASTTPSACSSRTASNAAPSRCIRSGSWAFPASIPPAASRGSMRPCPSSASTC